MNCVSWNAEIQNGTDTHPAWLLVARILAYGDATADAILDVTMPCVPRDAVSPKSTP